MSSYLIFHVATLRTSEEQGEGYHYWLVPYKDWSTLAGRRARREGEALTPNIDALLCNTRKLYFYCFLTPWFARYVGGLNDSDNLIPTNENLPTEFDFLFIKNWYRLLQKTKHMWQTRNAANRYVYQIISKKVIKNKQPYI